MEMKKQVEQKEVVQKKRDGEEKERDGGEKERDGGEKERNGAKKQEMEQKKERDGAEKEGNGAEKERDGAVNAAQCSEVEQHIDAACWYHRKFGDKAKKCLPPCQHKKETGKRQGGPTVASTSAGLRDPQLFVRHGQQHGTPFPREHSYNREENQCLKVTKH
ncbi:hypothetical protein ElyMa_000185500 [Elysia marginata]|uniref:Uncharacterized protein n=1 Tax=Elysia marginata TaxID=1093978 RepID=A0AAV4EVW2_9GAST|nr:hypothetical protein ElyMa_000185500 [Elysia marginata]